MANLNGKNVSFAGKTFVQIGELVSEASPAGDGRGVTLELDFHEENTFVRNFGLRVGFVLMDLVADAVEKKTGQRPNGAKYTYADRVFHT